MTEPASTGSALTIHDLDSIAFDIERTYICGNEMAVVQGVFSYRGDGAGKLIALRAFWEIDKLTLVEARGRFVPITSA